MKKVKLHGGSSKQSQPPISLPLPSRANVVERGKQITSAVSNTFQKGSQGFDTFIEKLAKTPEMKPIVRQTIEQPKESLEQQIIFKELDETRRILESLLIP